MLKHLQRLDLARTFVPSFPWLPESIQVLNMSACGFHPVEMERWISFNDAIKRNWLPNLTDLLVPHMHKLEIDGLRCMLAANKGELRTLNLRDCPRLSHPDIISLIDQGYLQSIVSLGVAGCDFNDQTAQLLAKMAPNLINLDADVTNVTGVGVKAILLKAGCPPENLRLNNCLLVGQDAVDFARSRGTNVEFFFYEKPGGIKMRRRGQP